jgi:glutathionyl-hydroquinone reductase
MAIPPKWIIEGGRSIWTQIWQIMMAQLAPASDRGDYQRPVSEFRQTIDNSENAVYQPAAQRYQLYVGWSCPWAHRTLLVRALKGLEEAIDLRMLLSDAGAGGWVLPEPEYGCQSLRELYRFAQPGYGGRCTVPMLWDWETRSIVNNESSEIIEILNSGFNEFAHQPELDLAPASLTSEIDEWNKLIYATVNNGVYRCGFAQSQAAYDRAVGELSAPTSKVSIIYRVLQPLATSL